MKAKNTLRCEHGKRHCSKTRRLGGMNNKQAPVRLAVGWAPQRAYMSRLVVAPRRDADCTEEANAAQIKNMLSLHVESQFLDMF